MGKMKTYSLCLILVLSTSSLASAQSEKSIGKPSVRQVCASIFSEDPEVLKSLFSLNSIVNEDDPKHQSSVNEFQKKLFRDQSSDEKNKKPSPNFLRYKDSIKERQKVAYEIKKYQRDLSKLISMPTKPSKSIRRKKEKIRRLTDKHNKLGQKLSSQMKDDGLNKSQIQALSVLSSYPEKTAKKFFNQVVNLAKSHGLNLASTNSSDREDLINHCHLENEILVEVPEGNFASDPEAFKEASAKYLALSSIRNQGAANAEKPHAYKGCNSKYSSDSCNELDGVANGKIFEYFMAPFKSYNEQKQEKAYRNRVDYQFRSPKFMGSEKKCTECAANYYSVIGKAPRGKVEEAKKEFFKNREKAKKQIIEKLAENRAKVAFLKISNEMERVAHMNSEYRTDFPKDFSCMNDKKMQQMLSKSCKKSGLNSKVVKKRLKKLAEKMGINNTKNVSLKFILKQMNAKVNETPFAVDKCDKEKMTREDLYILSKHLREAKNQDDIPKQLISLFSDPGILSKVSSLLKETGSNVKPIDILSEYIVANVSDSMSSKNSNFYDESLAKKMKETTDKDLKEFLDFKKLKKDKASIVNLKLKIRTHLLAYAKYNPMVDAVFSDQDTFNHLLEKYKKTQEEGSIFTFHDYVTDGESHVLMDDYGVISDKENNRRIKFVKDTYSKTSDLRCSKIYEDLTAALCTSEKTLDDYSDADIRNAVLLKKEEEQECMPSDGSEQILTDKSFSMDQLNQAVLSYQSAQCSLQNRDQKGNGVKVADIGLLVPEESQSDFAKSVILKKCTKRYGRTIAGGRAIKDKLQQGRDNGKPGALDVLANTESVCTVKKDSMDLIKDRFYAKRGDPKAQDHLQHLKKEEVLSLPDRMITSILPKQSELDNYLEEEDAEFLPIPGRKRFARISRPSSKKKVKRAIGSSFVNNLNTSSSSNSMAINNSSAAEPQNKKVTSKKGLLNNSFSFDKNTHKIANQMPVIEPPLFDGPKRIEPSEKLRSDLLNQLGPDILGGLSASQLENLSIDDIRRLLAAKSQNKGKNLSELEKKKLELLKEIEELKNQTTSMQNNQYKIANQKLQNDYNELKKKLDKKESKIANQEPRKQSSVVPSELAPVKFKPKIAVLGNKGLASGKYAKIDGGKVSVGVGGTVKSASFSGVVGSNKSFAVKSGGVVKLFHSTIPANALNTYNKKQLSSKVQEYLSFARKNNLLASQKFVRFEEGVDGKVLKIWIQNEQGAMVAIDVEKLDKKTIELISEYDHFQKMKVEKSQITARLNALAEKAQKRKKIKLVKNGQVIGLDTLWAEIGIIDGQIKKNKRAIAGQSN